MRDLGSIPGSERATGERTGYPLQYSSLKNSMDCLLQCNYNNTLNSLSLSLREPKNIEKVSLPIMWKSNPKSWVTQVIFQDLFFHQFISEVEKHRLGEDIPFNILLLLVSAPGQPPFTDNFHPIVRVVHLPPNTTSLIKPTDQGVIAIFKKYYLHHTFHQAVKASDESGSTL